MSFKQIPDPNPDVQTLNRIQQNVAAAFRELESPATLAVQVVQSSTSVNSYLVKPTDVYLVVDAKMGPIKIVLPAPDKQTQAVSIKNAFTGGAVSIVQSDGKVMGDGAASIGLPATESLKMLNTGKAWFRLGA